MVIFYEYFPPKCDIIVKAEGVRNYYAYDPSLHALGKYYLAWCKEQSVDMATLG